MNKPTPEQAATEQPSDATRFATRPKQRATENLNATDNAMAKDRAKTVEAALAALDAGMYRVACHEMKDGWERQLKIEDHRILDPESVAEQFAATERRLERAIEIRALIAQAGLNHD